VAVIDPLLKAAVGTHCGLIPGAGVGVGGVGVLEEPHATVVDKRMATDTTTSLRTAAPSISASRIGTASVGLKTRHHITVMGTAALNTFYA